MAQAEDKCRCVNELTMVRVPVVFVEPSCEKRQGCTIFTGLVSDNLQPTKSEYAATCFPCYGQLFAPGFRIRLAHRLFLAQLISFFSPFTSCFSQPVHHTLYVALGCFLQSKNASISLALAFPEELPTFILALGTVVPSWRSDTLFGWTFFATRLLYHGWYLLSSAYFSYFQLDSHERSSRDHVAVLALSSAMILHIFWFSNWMAKRHSYRYKKQQELQRTHMISPVPAAVDAPPVK